MAVSVEFLLGVLIIMVILLGVSGYIVTKSAKKVLEKPII